LRCSRLRTMEIDDTPCHRKTPENIVGCCDQALGICLYLILETALGIESFRISSVAGRSYLEPSKQQQTSMPKKFGISRKACRPDQRLFVGYRGKQSMGPYAGKADTAAVTASASAKAHCRCALLKNSPDLMSTPLLLPLAVRENERNQLGKRSLRLRVKSEADCLISGSIFLGIRLRKDSTVSFSWHGFFKAGSVPWQSTP